VSAWEKAGPVVVLDLRDDDPAMTGATGLRASVEAALREEDQPDAWPERFLVVDRATALVEHQDAYERVLSYGSHGSARLLCLALSLPGEAVGEVAASPWVLRLPALLRSPNVAVLWVGDLRPGRLPGMHPLDAAGASDDPGALRALVDLLRGHELFDEVLRAVGTGSDGVAVPALRMLELDLGDEAKDRAYRQALVAFAGDQDERPAAGGRVEDLPEPLLRLVDPGRAADAWVWQRAGGRADQEYRRCDRAVADAESVYVAMRGWTGLLGPGRHGEDASSCLEEAASGLSAYRALVVRALQDSDSSPGLPPERRERLARLGIDPPHAAELSREQVGTGLWEYLLRLLEDRVPLRSAVALLTRLAARIAPGGSAARLADLEEGCPAELAGEVSGAGPFSVRGSAPTQLAGAFAAAALAAMAPGWGLVSGLVLAVAQGGLTLLADARRPNRTAGREVDGGSSTGALAQTLAGAAGALGGALLAATRGVPPWAGLLAVAAGLILAVGLALHRWTAAVDLWWSQTGAGEAREALLGAESVLADAVRDDWLAANARLYGSDGARAVAGLLRRLADVAHAVAAQPSFEAYAAAPAGGHATPVWLERAPGEAGPELVGTLVGDLAEAAVVTLYPFWGVVEGSPGETRSVPVEERFGELLAVSRRVLTRHGLAHPPPFIRYPERRATPPILLDVGGDRLAQVLRAGDAPEGVVPLCTAEQARLVSRDPNAACWIRFAPDSSRVAADASAVPVGAPWRGAGPTSRPPGAGGGEPPWAGADDLLWTSSGQFAGVLRLTPVRRDALAVVRPRQERVGERKP